MKGSADILNSSARSATAEWTGATDDPAAERALLTIDLFSVAIKDEFLAANAGKPILFVFGWDAPSAAYIGPFTRGLRLIYVKTPKDGRYPREAIAAIQRIPHRIVVCLSYESISALRAVELDLGPIFIAARATLNEALGEEISSLRFIPLDGPNPDWSSLFLVQGKPRKFQKVASEQLLPAAIKVEPTHSLDPDMVLVAGPCLLSEGKADLQREMLAAIREKHPGDRVVLLDNPYSCVAGPLTSLEAEDRITLSTLRARANHVVGAYCADPSLVCALRSLGIEIRPIDFPKLGIELSRSVQDAAVDALYALDLNAQFRSRIKKIALSHEEVRKIVFQKAKPDVLDRLVLDGVLHPEHAVTLRLPKAHEASDEKLSEFARSIKSLSQAKLSPTERREVRSLLLSIALSVRSTRAALIVSALLKPAPKEAEERLAEIMSILVRGSLLGPSKGAVEQVAKLFAHDYEFTAELIRRLTQREFQIAANELAGLAELATAATPLLAGRYVALRSSAPVPAQDEAATPLPEVQHRLSPIRAAQLRGDWAEVGRLLSLADQAATPNAALLARGLRWDVLLGLKDFSTLSAELQEACSSSVNSADRDKLVGRLVQVYLAQDKVEAALALLREERKLGSVDAARRILGTIFLHGGTEEEIAYLRNAISSGAGANLRICDHGLFDCLWSLQEFKEAEDELRRAASAKRFSAEAVAAHIAKAYLNIGRTEDVERTLRSFPTSSQVSTLRVRAALARFKHRDAKAREYLEAAIVRDPRHVQTRAGLAMLLAEQGQFAEALRHYEILLKRSPSQPAYIKGWATSIRGAGQLASMVDNLVQHLRSGNFEASHAHWLSELLMQSGRVEQATKVAVKGASTYHRQFPLIRKTVELLQLSGEAAKAKQVVERFATSSAFNSATYANLAELWRLSGAPVEAEAAARDAINLGLFNSLSLEQSARILVETAAPDALDVAAMAVRADPGREGPHIAASMAARMKKSPKQAKSHAFAAVGLRPDSGRALATRARVHEEAGDFDDALQDFECSQRLRRIAFERYDVRELASISSIAGSNRDWRTVKAAMARVTTAMRQSVPHDLTLWAGEPLTGKRICVAMRGGPGDEARFYNSILSSVYAEARHLVFVGDARLRSIFERNFPKATFVANRAAGRRMRPGELLNIPRIEPGTEEILTRLGISMPRGVLKDIDYFAFSDDVTLYKYFSSIEQTHSSLHQYGLSVDPAASAKARAMLDALGRGPKVGMAWRGAYFSPTRPVSAFLSGAEVRPILETPGVTFLDFHTFASEEEAAIIRQYGAKFVRLPNVDFLNDFEVMAALSLHLDALVTTATTQRDLAGAVGCNNIWSFNVREGAAEIWRVIDGGQEDCWQRNIVHHDLRMYPDRSAIVEAIAGRVSQLATQPTVQRATNTSRDAARDQVPPTKELGRVRIPSRFRAWMEKSKALIWERSRGPQ